MAACRKCGKSIEAEWIVCPWCGTSVKIKPKKVKTRGNGQGTAYQRGKTWTAKIIIRWEVVENEDGTKKLKPISNVNFQKSGKNYFI